MDYERGGTQKEYYAEDEVIERDCPVCKSSNYLKIHAERGSIGIVRCKQCDLIYTNPTIKDPGGVYWGDADKYYEEARLIFKGSQKHHRDQNYIDDINKIASVRPRGNFLDIGTNMGFFLRHTRGREWNVFGVEPSPSLSEMARKYFGLNVKTAYLEMAGFEASFFDVVTMTDVFEHILTPKKMLQDIKKVLKKDGIVFIKVPNGKYNLLKLRLAKLSGKPTQYDIFGSYEHVVHYTHETLKKMLKAEGFDIKEVFISKPIQVPVWHEYVGHYYQYPSPWMMDTKKYFLRSLFYWMSKIEFFLRRKKIGYFASNITVIAKSRA